MIANLSMLRRMEETSCCCECVEFWLVKAVCRREVSSSARFCVEVAAKVLGNAIVDRFVECAGT